ncbi:MAG: carboxypeptidase regulatory-like domain-containing protein [Acidobacteria bacterium]|nr:carboxypeptidase regulatory-like domain-containing protein [Acidobacteriota bacterium]
MMKHALSSGFVGLGLAVLLIGSTGGAGSSQVTGEAVQVDNDDVGGVVTGPRGPEAGVWVIAETTDLPTRFARIVVTDDRGRFVVPDLPTATYSVWVRGYGLVDSPKVQAVPGRLLNLTAVAAPNTRAAAEYYPASYWYSLAQVPDKSEFPGTGDSGNGIGEAMRSQADWLAEMRCGACHQIGSKATREIPKSLGTFDSSVAAWERRLQSGQMGANMSGALRRFGRQRALKMYADWTDRIAAGDVPPAPPRPQGIERNVVISLWDWNTDRGFVHDTISTDKRNPTLNANGLVYSISRFSAPEMNILDQVRHTVTGVKVPVRDPDTPFTTPQKVTQPSPYWGEEIIWSSRPSLHNPMLDQRGRVWLTHAIRASADPAFCKEGSSHPSARAFPLTSASRHASVYDPNTKRFTFIDTCFPTHHLQFSEDANNTLWFSSGGSGGRQVLGWLNTKLFDQTGDAVQAQGWTPFVIDTNGNGKRDEYVEPNQPIDPTKDKRIQGGSYGVIPNPVDGSMWTAAPGVPGAIIRVDPGPDPTKTALSEIYEPPFNNPKSPVNGYLPRGIDVDRNGIIWTALAGSGHLASFDRRKCQVLRGPTATGQHCPEGWTLYLTPGPKFKGVTDEANTDMLYYNWVDQFDTLGLGRNVPFATGSYSDALLALSGGKFVVFRVPYPVGFYHRGVEGRIDDPNAGWKGRGLWANYGSYNPWHYEGGKGQTSKAVHFQLRPGPLAK